MTAPLKPGTRCECRAQECGKSQPRKIRVEHHPGPHADLNWECGREAVRMVTVALDERDEYFRSVNPILTKNLLMCAPCAAYHEAKAGRMIPTHGVDLKFGPNVTVEPPKPNYTEVPVMPQGLARCDVCNELKPRDEVRLLTPASAAGTETWACDECRAKGEI